MAQKTRGNQLVVIKNLELDERVMREHFNQGMG